MGFDHPPGEASAGVGLTVVVAVLVRDGGVGVRHPAIDQTLRASGGQRPDVILDLVPPGGRHARELEAVQKPRRLQGGHERVEDLGACGCDVLSAAKFHEPVAVATPPGVEALEQQSLATPDAGVALHEGRNRVAAVHRRGEVVVGLVAFDERHLGVKAVGPKQVELRGHFGLRHAAQQVCLHVLPLGRRGVVGVAADVEVVVGCLEVGLRSHGGVAGYDLEGFKGRHDPLQVLRTESVLAALGLILQLGVDEEDPPLARRQLRSLGPADDDTGRNAGAVEQVGGQSDHGLQQVVFDQPGADLLFHPRTEEHAVRHHGGQHAARVEHGQHVLEEHQVGLLPLFRTEAVDEPLRELHPLASIALAEGWIADHAVESHQAAVFQVCGCGERVVVSDVGVGNAVEDHVHFRHRPHFAVVVLAEQLQRAGARAAVLDVPVRRDEHTTRTAARVVDPHAFAGVEQADHQADHVAGRVELAAFLAGRVGKLAYQVLVRGTEEVWELEVLVQEAVLVEVADELAEVVVGDACPPHAAGEVDVAEHAFK